VALTEGACVSEVSTMEKPPMPRIFEKISQGHGGPDARFFQGKRVLAFGAEPHFRRGR